MRKEKVNSMELDTIKIVITSITHVSRWKQNLQREFGEENVFDPFFAELVMHILDL